MAAIIFENDDSRYFHYWLTANYKNIRGIASDDLRDGLNLTHLKQIPCPRPPIDEQKAISDHLDRETARIEALISQKEREIALLREMKASIIADTVLGREEISPIGKLSKEGGA